MLKRPWSIDSRPLGGTVGWTISAVYFDGRSQHYFETLREVMYAWRHACRVHQFDTAWVFRARNADTEQTIFLGVPRRPKDAHD